MSEPHDCYNYFPVVKTEITLKDKKIQIWKTGRCDRCNTRYKVLATEYRKQEELYGCMLYDKNWKEHPNGAKLND